MTQSQRSEWFARAEERQRLERERLAAEQREQRRIGNLKNHWASITAARANAVLAGYQHARYYEKSQKLIALDRLINGE